MKIFALNLQNKRYLRENLNISEKPAFCGGDSCRTDKVDSVEIRPACPYETALKKLQKITKNEYNSLTEKEKSELRLKINNLPDAQEIKTDVKMHRFAAEAIRQVFDAQYGKGNYVVVPVGRSLSSISRLLAMKIGEENVKNIPMSNMQKYYVEALDFGVYMSNMEHFKNQKGYNEVKKYLDSVGLSKDDVEKSGKAYILMDYKCSGMSLGAAYAILSSDLFCSDEKMRMTSASMSEITAATSRKSDEAQNLDKNLEQSKYKKYSFVQLTKQDLTRYKDSAGHGLFWLQNPTEAKRQKLFGFALLDDEFGDNHDKSQYKNILSKSDDGKIKGQNKKIWLSTRQQFKLDKKEDAYRLYNLIMRLEKSIDVYNSLMQKLELSEPMKNDKLLESAKNSLESAFPLEYKYYKNRKQFEKIEHLLPKDTYYELAPKICKEFPDFNSNAPLYKLFEDADNKFNGTIDLHSVFFQDEKYADLLKARRLLQDFELDLNMDRIINKNFEKQDMEAFYEDFRPVLHETMDKISKKYAPEAPQNLKNEETNLYQRFEEKLDEEKRAFLCDLDAKIKILNGAKDKANLSQIVENQNNLLLRAMREIELLS